MSNIKQEIFESAVRDCITFLSLRRLRKTIKARTVLKKGCLESYGRDTLDTPHYYIPIECLAEAARRLGFDVVQIDKHEFVANIHASDWEELNRFDMSRAPLYEARPRLYMRTDLQEKQEYCSL